jgi:hypothetical protein
MTILFCENDTVLSTEDSFRLTGCAAQTGFGPQEPTYTFDVLNLMHKLDEQLLTSFETTVIKVWKNDVKNVLGTGAMAPHTD